MRIEKQRAVNAPQNAARDERVGIGERMMREHLAAARTLAALAPELPVEGFERAPLRVELVGEALDHAPRGLGVEFYKPHGPTVERPHRAGEAMNGRQEELA
jgi:hypothetical protein